MPTPQPIETVLSTDRYIPAPILSQLTELRTGRTASDMYASMERECTSVHVWTPTSSHRAGRGEGAFGQIVGVCIFLAITGAFLILCAAGAQ